ncbi:MAG: hypothetical protein Q9M11_03395 [Mariprofundaceae bacterium]|nr:hypothetical protein [Mariprofundaceae bacterium]
MGLSATTDATAINKYISGLTTDSVLFIDNISTILDTGFQAAVPSLLNLDISPAAGTLALPHPSGGNSTMPELIGKACADYWQLAIGKGAPQHKAAVTGVSNDASKIAAPIALSIRGLATGGYLVPSYTDFVTVIHNEVLTIKWTVNEADGSGSTTDLVTVS